MLLVLSDGVLDTRLPCKPFTLDETQFDTCVLRRQRVPNSTGLLWEVGKASCSGEMEPWGMVCNGYGASEQRKQDFVFGLSAWRGQHGLGFRPQWPHLWNQHNCSDLDHLGTQREPGDNAVSEEALERCAVGFQMSAPISLSPAKTSGTALLCNGTVGVGHSLFCAIKESSIVLKSASTWIWRVSGGQKTFESQR